jgi:hypothetical protein
MRRGGRGLDWSGVAGIAFVALVVVDVLALANQLDSHKSRSEFASYYAHFRGSSHEWRELVATVVGILAAFCFAWFLRRLADEVRTVDTGLAAVVLGGGFLFLALFLAALVLVTAVGTTLAYSDSYRVNLDTAILMSDIGLFLYTAAMAGAAIMVWGAALAARRGALQPSWLIWAGFAVAVVCLATTAVDGLSFLLLLAWILVVSFRPRSTPAVAAAAVPRSPP